MITLQLLPQDRAKPTPEAAGSDLLAPLSPSAADAERPAGALRLAGTHRPVEGLGAGCEVWCGPMLGWRPLGEVLGAGVVRHEKRLRVCLSFDLGPLPTRWGL